MRAYACSVKRWKLRQAGIARGVLFDRNFTALGAQKVRDFLQRKTGALSVVFAYQCDMAELRLHRQITSQHHDKLRRMSSCLMIVPGCC